MSLLCKSRGLSLCQKGGGYGFQKLQGEGSRQRCTCPITGRTPFTLSAQQLHSTIRKNGGKKPGDAGRGGSCWKKQDPTWVSKTNMAFFNSAITVLQTLVIALGAGLGIWGAINLLEGYGNDNPGAKSQGMKQLMAGGGVALIGTTLVPLLSGLFG